MADGQSGLVAVAVRGDVLAIKAVRILKRQGARTAEVPKSLADKVSGNGYVMFTGKNLPARFPNTYFRALGNTVYVRTNPDKQRRCPEGFQIGAMEMGVRLGLLPKPQPAKRARKHSKSRYRVRRGERSGLRI